MNMLTAYLFFLFQKKNPTKQVQKHRLKEAISSQYGKTYKTV